MTEDESGYALVMPFVTVTSKGGPHEDRAYCAGFAMGELDMALRMRKAIDAFPLSRPIETVNRPQADLIAMKHGCVASFAETEVEGWLTLTVDLAEEPA
ncbi:hypothetical protein AB0H71_13815 [Nocardia sp. NPDC050697]|uniref:hypothetical protein n=1 Tax=Nocardia sp. NPDC050697 TaxID=3155158 RepID=UPI0033F51912